MHEISQDYLKSILKYDEKSGVFYWLKRDRSLFLSDKGFKIFNSKFSGKIAGNIHKTDKNLYITIRIRGSLYYAHRLAWIYAYGFWPNVIDHIDGDGVNNKIDNLRSVTNQINSKNQRLKETNSSGRVGVYFNKEIKKWIAQCKENGKTRVILCSDNFDLASEARKNYENFNEYHENHGAKRLPRTIQ